MERGNFFETVQTASYFVMFGFFVLLVATIFLGIAQATLTQILQELRRIQTPAPQPPTPQPAPPAERTWEDIQKMIKQQSIEFQEWYKATKAEELLRWREAAASRPAMVPPPVTNTPAKPATPAHRPAAPSPTPPKPTP